MDRNAMPLRPIDKRLLRFINRLPPLFVRLRRRRRPKSWRLVVIGTLLLRDFREEPAARTVFRI